MGNLTKAHETLKNPEIERKRRQKISETMKRKIAESKEWQERLKKLGKDFGFKKGHKLGMTGKHHTPETKRKISIGLKGDKNYRYQPDFNKLKYVQKHLKMRKTIPKPRKCPVCGENKKLDLTNLDHNYSQNKDDWVWKCRKCHIIYDK